MGDTLIVCAVAPVVQAYEAKPAPASSVTVPPAHTVAGPVIVTIGNGLTITVVETGSELTPLIATISV